MDSRKETRRPRVLGLVALMVGASLPCLGQGPVLVESPQSRTSEVLSSMEFHVIATSATKLSYQWRFAGEPLLGETNPIVILRHLQTNQAGGYSVVASNSGGAVTSGVAMLTIVPRTPTAKLMPVGLADGRVTFAVEGDRSRHYFVESSTNLVDWSQRTSLLFGPGDEFPVFNINEVPGFSISVQSPHKFLRTVPDLNYEVCIAQLQAIRAAIRLYGIETGAAPDDAVVAIDLEPYFTTLPACPSGGVEATFEDSYEVTTVEEPPKCEISYRHLLLE